MPTIVITLIMSTGSILNIGFEKVFIMQNPSNYGISEIISTYVYKVGVKQAQFSFSTAIGLFNAAVNFMVLFIVNQTAKRVSDTSLCEDDLMKKTKMLENYYWYKFLLYYLLIFTIPFCVIVFAYIDSYKTTLSRFCEEQTSELIDSSNQWESSLRQAKNLTQQVSMNYYVKQFAQQDKPTAKNTVVADIFRLRPMIASYLIMNQSIKEIQICYEKSNTMISNQSTYLDSKKLYGDIFEEDGTNYKEWYHWYFGTIKYPHFERREAKIKGKTANWLIYRQPMYSPQSGRNANIFAYLNEENLLEILENMKGVKDGFVFYYNVDGTVISRNEKLTNKIVEKIIFHCTSKSGFFMEQLDGVDMIISYYNSSEMEGFYVSAVQESYILEEIKNIRNLFLVIVTITIIIGILLILLLAYKTASPLSNLIKLLKINEFMDKTSYSDNLLNQEVLKIIQKNKKLASKVEEQIPTMKVSLF